MTMRWIGAGRSARGAPGPRCSRRLRWASFALVALAGLLQTGCQSASCGPCGGVNPCRTGPCAYLKGLRERMFSRGSSAACCGPMMGGEAPLEMGTPAIVAPGMSPGMSPGVSPALPAAPPAEDLSPLPIEKEREPKAIPETGSKSGASKTNYEAARPRYRVGRNATDDLSRTVATTSEPTSRSAQGSLSSSGPDESWLDNLPPLNIPRDEARGGPPAPARASVAETSQKVADAAEAAKPDAQAEVSVAPGIRRFQSLEPRLAGGSLPTTEGLDWLVEKGYKTILDLRESRDVQPSFIAEVTDRGLRYVALPIGLTTLDSAHVARFNQEIELSEGRPLYFCDADGTRPGALWYVRRMTKEKVDPAVARRQAVDVGLADEAFWAAVTSYLDGLKPGPKPAPRPEPKPGPKPADANPPEPTELQTPSNLENQLDPQAATEPADKVTGIEETPFKSLNEVDARDTTAWRSYAALVVTGLGVPLAYWGRSSLHPFRLFSRASLPAPGRRPRSLPPASGA